MNTYKITFSDGNMIITGMNATMAEAEAYYLGTKFQLGDTDKIPHDYLVEVVRVEEVRP